jgi:hypothetical protein
MSVDLNGTLQWAHRANIERYRRILETEITAREREFIERRLAEEEESLLKISRETGLTDTSPIDQGER